MNAVIYARFSSHSQREQSIEGQLRDCYEYARRYDITIVGEYIDRALSGLTDDRPDFQRMIADASKKQFERVIVWKLDRFARNRYDSALYKHKLKQYGVRVVSAMENVGEGDESILLEALLEASAEYYSLDLKKKIKRGQRENVSKGKYNGGTVPYGYKLSNGKLVIDDGRAPAVRYLFDQYASGVPMKEIIDELTRRGVRGLRGGALNYNSFSRVLTNTVYIGEYRYNGEVVPGLAEPMIDRETFEKAQEFVKANAHAPAANKADVEYLLQGKAFCGYCGSHMIGECGRGRNGAMYNYYTCAARKKHHKCRKKNERKDFIEWYVVEQTLQYVLTPTRIRQVAKAVVAHIVAGVLQGAAHLDLLGRVDLELAGEVCNVANNGCDDHGADVARQRNELTEIAAQERSKSHAHGNHASGLKELLGKARVLGRVLVNHVGLDFFRNIELLGHVGISERRLDFVAANKPFAERAADGKSGDHAESCRSNGNDRAACCSVEIFKVRTKGRRRAQTAHH